MVKNIKMLMFALIVALSTVSCEKDKPVSEPPTPPAKAKIELSVSEKSLMLGMSGAVEIKNVTKLTIKESKKDIAQLSYDPDSKTLKINTQGLGEVTFDITDEGNPSYVVKLSIKVTVVVFGMVDGAEQKLLVANYRYQATKNLTMATSGAERRNQFIKVPLKTEWKQGEAVSVAYKKNADTPEQTIQTTVSQFRDISTIKSQVVYLKTEDGKYIIFPVYKK